MVRTDNCDSLLLEVENDLKKFLQGSREVPTAEGETSQILFEIIFQETDLFSGEVDLKGFFLDRLLLMDFNN